jgi:hypothetical protein
LHLLEKKFVSARKFPFLGLLLIGSLGVSDGPAADETMHSTSAIEFSCGENGMLKTSIYGVLETNVVWDTSEMVCESMLRPGGEGMRLRFSGDISGERLNIIIAMPGLKPVVAGVDVPSNVTVTVEGSGRFFSTPNLDSCWTEIGAQSALSGQDGIYAIEGTLFCVTPLGEINGDAAISIPELSFSTTIQWSSK